MRRWSSTSLQYGDLAGTSATGGLLQVGLESFLSTGLSRHHPLTSHSATYLETLETSAGMLGIALPYLGEFIKPKGALPGLC